MSLSFPVLDFDLPITFTLDQVSKDCESSDPGGARVVQSVHNGFVFVTAHAVFLPLNGPFAQLLPGLETGHPVTVGQSPASESHKEQSENRDKENSFLLVDNTEIICR